MRFKFKQREPSGWPKYIEGSDGYERIVKKFLIFPKIISYDFRWLETVYYHQVYPKYDYTNYDDWLKWEIASTFLELGEVPDYIRAREQELLVKTIV